MSAIGSNLRVIILGAGASAACGIPVAKDILRESMIALAATNPDAAHEVQGFLSYLYPDFEEAYRNYPNIEDFLNLIEMALTFNSEEFIESDLWPQHRVAAVKRTVLRAVTDYIWAFFVSPRAPCRHLEAFIQNHVPLGNVIVTFNWDLTVERSLVTVRDNVPIAYQYSSRNHEKTITLLKPHGSVNWFRTKATTDFKLAETEELDPKVRLVNFKTLLYSRDLIKDPPIIVPPVSNKEFSEYTVLQRTWNSVYRAISSATVLTILGYSLPREDQFARFVFRRALRNNIRKVRKKEKEQLEVIVVNPDETAEGTFSRLVGRDGVKFRFHRAYFQDFVDSLSS